MAEFNELARTIHEWARSKGFYDREVLGVIPAPQYHVPSANPADGPREIRNPSLPAEKLLLIVSEVSETLSALRDGDREHEAEEIADTMIRILDYAAWRGIDLDAEVKAKMAFNDTRPRFHGRTF